MACYALEMTPYLSSGAFPNLRLRGRFEFGERFEIRETRFGKYVEAFALEGDFNVDHVHSDTFSIEWPPRSGHMQSFPEVDRAAWFAVPLARKKILVSQRPFLDRLENLCEQEC